MPRQHLVQHTTERVEIASAVELLAPHRLLGTHIGRRPHGDPRLGESPAPRLRDRSRNPEIRHHCVPALHENVLGLHVPVHHVVAVGVAQRIRHLQPDPERVGERQLSLPGQALTQRLAFHIGHRVVHEAICFPGVEQRQDVGMVESGGDPDFP